jgi:DNA-binding response OmpR family regulator
MPKRILIAEKSDYIALKLTEYLRTAGYEIVRAKSGQLTISALRRALPDLLILSEELSDMDSATILERMRNMFGIGKVPILMITGSGGGGVPHNLKLHPKERVDSVQMPVALELLRLKVGKLLLVPDTGEDRVLNAEVFIRDGIVIIELRGFLTGLGLVALKYSILDLARADQTLNKRFFLIIYDLEKEGLSQEAFNRIFDFVVFFKDTPKQNFKILTSSETIKAMIARNPTSSQFEIVENYIDGLEKLKSLYLKQGEDEVRLEFLQPDAVLFKDVYNRNGNLIKAQGKSFSQEELNALKRQGVKSLFYTRRARVDDDRQIAADENVDVVLDAIRLTGIIIPEGLKTAESKQRLKLNILIVNGDSRELEMLNSFFTSRGFQVQSTSRMGDALRLASEMLCDYMIVDLKLEDGNGLDLIRAAKSREQLGSCQFLVTGKAVHPETVREAVSLGVKGFLRSPVDVGKLKNIFKR